MPKIAVKETPKAARLMRALGTHCQEIKVEPIYNRTGQIVAWQRGTDIYHFNGAHAAVINGTNVYGHQGQQLGVFQNELFRDHRGGVVAFMKGALGGPVLPVPSAPPVPPVPSVPPVPAVPSVPRVPAVPSLGWGQEWDQFISA